ncbi:MAG: MG2 domain-containing protein, partial [Acidimicrobiia bacterium]
PFLSVTFNQPMVPLATVSQLDAADVPVTITPELPGRWQWIGTRTLRFEHDPTLFDRLPMATDYRVEIPAGTVSETGGALAGTVTWDFSTPSVQVESFQPQDESLPLEPVFLVTFNQRIDPAAVLETITLTAGGVPQPLRLATETEIAADEQIGQQVGSLLDGRWLAFRAVDAFAPDTQLTIQVGPGVPSAEGPRVATDSSRFTARTFAPLHINDWSCRNAYPCEPGWDELWIGLNNQLDTDAFDPSMVTVEPDLPGMTVQAQYDSITIRGATVGNTTYTATLSTNLKDVYGQTLEDDASVDFIIGDARPRLDQFEDQLITLDPLAPKPSLAVTTVNHEELRVRLFKVDVDDWASYVGYWDRRWDSEKPPPLPDWTEVVDTKVDTNAEPNQLTETTIDLSGALNGGTGHVIVLVEPTGPLADLSPNNDDYWSNRPTLVWAQATQIGADIFNDGDESLVWATDLRTGEPLAGVEAEFVGTATTVTTNSDGLARTTTPAGSSYEHPVVARLGNDSAIVESGWQQWSRTDESLWYVFDDRQMYRPGETARIKGWVRRLTTSDDAQLAAVTPGAKITYQATDWYGNEIATGTAEVNVLGGFDFDIDIPAGANLGQASINLTGAGGSYSQTIQIQEFRTPEFEVTTRPESAGPYIVGDPATVAVQADYYSGGPLPDAEVEWTVTTRQATYSPPNWDDYTFGIWIPWWYDTFGSGGDVFYESDVFFGEPGPAFDAGTVETFSGRTDANGTHYLHMDFAGDGEGLPTTVSAQATVFDVNRQAWSDGTDVLVHPAELYVGLRSDRTYVESGEPIVIDAIVTDIDGNAVADRPVAMEAGRLEWRLVDGQWDEVPVEIEPCTVTSSDQPVDCEFSTDIGGTYQIVATVTDGAGRSSRTELTRWVSGGKQRPERNVTQEEVTLIPDKQEYAPGDQAEILVTAPFSPAHGLLTISRGGFVSTETFTIEDGSTVLSIPIEDDYIPNVHIQVDLVGATGRTDDNGDPLPDAPDRPAFAVGSLDLQIPPYSRTLTVVADPAEPTTEPGSTTSIDVAVADAVGAPVAGAELAVVVVDEAVLALSDYQLPDPLD